MSAPFGRASVEVGAQWIMGAETNPISELATQYRSPRASFSTNAGQNFAGAAVAQSNATSTLATQFWQQLAQMHEGSVGQYLQTSLDDV